MFRLDSYGRQTVCAEHKQHAGCRTIPERRQDRLLEKGDICSDDGRGPRDFEVYGETIVVANQYSDNLAIIKYTANTGKMQLISNDESVSKPVMICVVR